MSKRLGGNIGCQVKTSSWHLIVSSMVVTLGQQDNVGEKPTIIQYTYYYINHHAGTPSKTKIKYTMSLDTAQFFYVGFLRYIISK